MDQLCLPALFQLLQSMTPSIQLCECVQARTMFVGASRHATSSKSSRLISAFVVACCRPFRASVNYKQFATRRSIAHCGVARSLCNARCPPCACGARASRGRSIHEPNIYLLTRSCRSSDRCRQWRQREFKVGGDEPCEPTVRLPD